MSPARTEHAAGSVIWQDQGKGRQQLSSGAAAAALAPSREPSLRSVLELHLHLSSQISQALFAAIQAAFSTAHPPSAIQRPAWLPESLNALPIWSLPPHTSPTTEALIPSLAAVHKSLDDLMLRARTHRANVQRVQALRSQIAEMQSLKRSRIRALRDASADLRDLVGTGREELKKTQRARQTPLSYTDVLAYAADLARNTSAPPGWSGRGLLGDAAERAMQAKRPSQQGQEGAPDGVDASMAEPQESVDHSKTQQDASRSSPPGQQQAQQKDEESDDGGTRGGSASHSGTPRTMATLDGQVKSGTPNVEGVTEDTDGNEQTREVDAGSPRAGAAPTIPAAEPSTRRLLDADGAASGAASAPYSLPFPSDADMRRGLMGVAMLEEQQQQDHAVAVGQSYALGSAINVVLPNWKEFLVHFAAQHGQSLPSPPAGDSGPGQAQPPSMQAGGMVNPGSGEEAMEEEGFGLDLI